MTTPNHHPAGHYIPSTQIAEAEAAGRAQYLEYGARGFTAVDIANEAYANLEYFARQLAQAEALLAAANASPSNPNR